MEDRPDGAALLDAVEALLRDEIVPRLDGAVAYHARIAASIVAIVARRLRLAPAAEAEELDRLQALVSEERDLSALTAALAAQLRTGALAIDDPAVADHLWRTTRAKLAIDQPRYPRLAQMEEEHDRTSDR